MARAIGILMILAGVVALLYGGFHWTQVVQPAAVAPVTAAPVATAPIAPAHVSLIDHQQMPVSPLAGAIALGIGVICFLLSIPRTRRVGS